MKQGDEHIEYIIEYSLNKNNNRFIRFVSDADFRNTWPKEYLDEMIKYFILSVENTIGYKEGDSIFASNIKMYTVSDSKSDNFYSTERVLQIYPPLSI